MFFVQFNNGLLICFCGALLLLGFFSLFTLSNRRNESLAELNNFLLEVDVKNDALDFSLASLVDLVSLLLLVVDNETCHSV